MKKQLQKRKLLTCSSINILLLGLNSAINSMLCLSKNVAMSTYDSDVMGTWVHMDIYIYKHKHAYIQTGACVYTHAYVHEEMLTG